MGSQTIGIVAPQGSSINWVAEASTTTGGSWLTVNPSRGTGTGSISVFVQLGGMPAGTYNGTVTITNQASNTRTQIPIALTLAASTGAQVPANGVVNAARAARLLPARSRQSMARAWVPLRSRTQPSVPTAGSRRRSRESGFCSTTPRLR